MTHNRKEFIGSSDAAALWGKSPYKSYYSLYKEKFEGKEIAVTGEPAKWGNRLESAIALGLAEDWGLVITKAELTYSISVDGMAATPDYYITGVSESTPEDIKEAFNTYGTGIFEIKNVDFFQAKKNWEEGESTNYIEIQVQHQMATTGLNWTLIGALVGGNTSKQLIRTINHDFVSKHIAKIEEFWKLTTPPHPDFHPATTSILLDIHKDVDPERVVLIDKPEVTNLARDFLAAQEVTKALGAELREKEKEVNFLKANLLEHIGDAGLAQISDLLVTSKLVTRKGFTTKDTSYRTVSIKRAEA